MDLRLEELRRRRDAGEHLGVIRLAQKLLESPEGLSDVESFEVARTGASAAITLKQFHLGYRFAQQERYWSHYCDDPATKAIASFHQGTTVMYLGDSHQAVEFLTEFHRLDSHQSPLLDDFRGAAHFNLGLARQTRREYTEAVHAFNRAREVFQFSSDHKNVIRSYLAAAWAELLADRPEAASPYLDRAVKVLTEYPDDHLSAVRLCHQAFYHYIVANLAEAVRLCEEVLTPDRPGVTSYQISEAAWIAGECALRTGQTDAARDLALLATDEALTAKWPVLMNRASDLRRRVAETEQRSA